MWMAGGGVRGGTSVGETDELGSTGVTDRFHVKHLHATVLNQMGIDNNSEYRMKGRFTGETIYESASNSFYPEFVATSFDVINTNPTSIFPVGYRASATEIQKPDL